MFSVLSKAFSKTLREIKNINKTTVILVGILLCILLLQITKMTNYGEPYATQETQTSQETQEGFELQNCDEIRDDEVARKECNDNNNLEKWKGYVEKKGEQLDYSNELQVKTLQKQYEQLSRIPKYKERIAAVKEMFDKYKTYKLTSRKIDILNSIIQFVSSKEDGNAVNTQSRLDLYSDTPANNAFFELSKKTQDNVLDGADLYDELVSIIQADANDSISKQSSIPLIGN